MRGKNDGGLRTTLTRHPPGGAQVVGCPGSRKRDLERGREISDFGNLFIMRNGKEAKNGGVRVSPPNLRQELHP